MLRRLEARGEIRGGRFVSGPFGEQFALEEAAEGLRAARAKSSDAAVQVSAADPLNLVGILLPGERVAAIPGRQIHLRNGNLDGADSASDAVVEPIPEVVPAAVSLWAEVAAQ
jgi:ATP-dependent helicase Lhr and Lhr-like helicase